jgi:hypothetical protein
MRKNVPCAYLKVFRESNVARNSTQMSLGESDGFLPNIVQSSLEFLLFIQNRRFKQDLFWIFIKTIRRNADCEGFDMDKELLVAADLIFLYALFMIRGEKHLKIR